MAEKHSGTADRRAALRQRLIDLATDQIAAEGLRSLKARSLAKDAECSVGAIYNVFGDLTDLILTVNGNTFRALGEAVRDAVRNADSTSPSDQLIAMAEGYLRFASDNPLLWRALFDLEMSRDSDIPDWYLAALDQLLAIIDAPLASVFPILSADEVRVRTRALFSSVHGITLLGLERRISAVEEQRLSEMIRFIILSVTSEKI